MENNYTIIATNLIELVNKILFFDIEEAKELSSPKNGEQLVLLSGLLDFYSERLITVASEMESELNSFPKNPESLELSVHDLSHKVLEKSLDSIRNALMLLVLLPTKPNEWFVNIGDKEFKIQFNQEYSS